MVECPEERCEGRLTFTAQGRRSTDEHLLATCPECGTTYALHHGQMRREGTRVPATARIA